VCVASFQNQEGERKIIKKTDNLKPNFCQGFTPCN